MASLPTVKAVLRATSALIGGGSWTFKAEARDAEGIECFALHPKASCYCLSGGVHRTLADMGVRNAFGWERYRDLKDEVHRAILESARDLGFKVVVPEERLLLAVRVVRLNDDVVTSYMDVDAILKRAIQDA